MNELEKQSYIKNMVYEIRGKQVMLDSDVAKLFDYEVKQLNRQVRRNINRFPENYCFQLTKEEYYFLRCQNGTLETRKGEYKKYLPFVFSEYGITMLAGVLKSDVAIEASIKIVNEFILLKKENKNLDIYKNVVNLENKINNKFEIYDKKFDFLYKEFNKEDFINKLFFNGQIFDAYDLIVDLIEKAKQKIIMIDNYIDNSILKMLSKKEKNVMALIITNPKNNKLNKLDIKKFNAEYPTMKIIYNSNFHDRFIILDDKELYHLGSSIKDLGNKTFIISKIKNNDFIKLLIKEIVG